jgi:hypothetical protein
MASMSFCAYPGIATRRSFAGVVGGTLSCCQEKDCAAEAPTPRLAVATGHAAVEAVDPTDVGVEHLDSVVEMPVD